MEKGASNNILSTANRRSTRTKKPAGLLGTLAGKHGTTLPPSQPTRRVLQKRKENKKKRIKQEEEEATALVDDKRRSSVELAPIQHRPPFSWSDAQRHLAAVEPRLAALFQGPLACRPFDGLVPLQPQKTDAFRNLCSSIIGQQVSFQAARSITYRFIRLFHPHLPEIIKWPENQLVEYPFPKPGQVVKATESELRSAGLSARKVTYVRDLASRFEDGRLETGSLLEMGPESLMSSLLEVRGIGRWTVQMFQIFCIRDPDVLPHTDLAIQKGLIKWYTTPIDPSICNSQAPISAPLDRSPPLIPAGSALSKSDLARRLQKPLKSGLYLTPVEMGSYKTHVTVI